MIYNILHVGGQVENNCRALDTILVVSTLSNALYILERISSRSTTGGSCNTNHGGSVVVHVAYLYKMILINYNIFKKSGKYNSGALCVF